jgi:hypothetical protein
LCFFIHPSTSILTHSTLTPTQHKTAWALRAHAAVLALLVLTSAHVQVATRLLALGAPGWLWTAAAVVAGDGRRQRVLWAWAAGCAAVGGVLHATWYPWT